MNVPKIRGPRTHGNFCICREYSFPVVMDLLSTFWPDSVTCSTISTKHSFKLNPPFWFDVSARADVVLAGEHKLIVKHPLRLVVQHSGWVQLHHLVVLHGQVMSGALQVSDLFTPQEERRGSAQDNKT